MVKPAPQTIRITPDVWEALGSRAYPFESPNDVLRRLLDLDGSALTKSDRSEGGKRGHPMGAKDAAALALEEEGRPMTARELYEAVDRKGYWHSGGRTPWATIGADIYTDIQTQGEASRFVKVGRGMFALRAK